MLERTCDLWDMSITADARCITTNGSVRKDGLLVMGRGVAAQAALKVPFLQEFLGWNVANLGSRCYPCYSSDLGCWIVSFPVKHQWFEKADLELIKVSCQQLMDLCTWFSWRTVLLPRPGCGNGGLHWDAVERVISPLLDSRIIVISKL